MAMFLVIGGIGLLLLLSTLLFADLLDGLFSSVDAISFDLDGWGLFSGPVIGGFLAAFGFGGALALSAGAPAPVGAAAGLGAGVAIGWVAVRLTRALMSLTEEPVRTTDLVGATGRVVTPVPAEGFGEITVRHCGQLLKLNASSDSGPIARSTTVVILEVTSPSSVVVADDAALWL